MSQASCKRARVVRAALSTTLCQLFFQLLKPPPNSTLFPYTTLFRSELTASAARFHLRTLSAEDFPRLPESVRDRKSTRLNSSHPSTSYAVFCLKKINRRTSPSCRVYFSRRLPNARIPLHTNHAPVPR